MKTNLMQNLEHLVSGEVITAEDQIYAEASRLFTGPTSPDAVVRPKSSRELASVIDFVRDNELPFAIKSGGHSALTGRFADNAVLIDMTHFKTIDMVDVDQGLVWVGAGALWYEVARELEAHGLCISSGDVRSVGVGGLTTGGGLGWLVRKHGLTVDNLVAVEIVTADGRVKEVNESIEPDLFWAIRGGGGNFGVVTRFLFKAQKAENFWLFRAGYEFETGFTFLKNWRDFMRSAPRELTTILSVLPQAGDSKSPSVLLRACIEGAESVDAEQLASSLLRLGNPTNHEIFETSYSQILDDIAPSSTNRVIFNNVCVKEFTDEVIETAVNLTNDRNAPTLQIRYVAGAMNDRPIDSTAFSFRDSEVLIISPTTTALDATELDVEMALRPWQIIKPLGSGCYLNMLTEYAGHEVQEAFYPETLHRLEKIKAKYDPKNLFCSNYNIRPAR